MLDYVAAARLPEKLIFSRNGREAEAQRVAVGEIEVLDGSLTVADSDLGGRLVPLPVRVPGGLHALHSYWWAHPQRPCNVCAVLAFKPQRLAFARKLRVENLVRPDLNAGVPVDSAAVRLFSKPGARDPEGKGLTIESGLGDGYYPVYGVFNFGLWLQALVVDFQLWKLKRYVLLANQEMDEYGLVVFKRPQI